MNPSVSSGRELSSWKEIADYLGVTVRTAQKWESERSLPIRRLPGAGRGRILIAVADLERWKQSGASAPPAAAPQRSTRAWKWAAAAGFLALTAAVTWAVISSSRIPVSCRVEGNALIVFDAHGRELWRKVLPDVAVEPDVAADRRQTWFEDIDSDGQVEVLYGHRPKTGVGESALYCYSQTGAQKWRFVPGRRVETRVEPFQPPYTVRAFAVIQPSPGAPKQIVVTSHHNLYYPDQVAILTSSGKLVREYWHSGWLEVLTVADLDGDGSPEIYLGGISNSHRQAVLVVLDPRSLGGASHEDNGDYQLLGFGPPAERARVLFPRSCLNVRSSAENAVRGIFISGGEVRMEVAEEFLPVERRVNWHLDASLRSSRVVLWDSFRGRHHELELSGAIRHHLTDDRSEFGALTWLPKP